MICGGANWRAMLRPAFSGAPRGFARGLEGLTNSSFYLFAALHGHGQASSWVGTHPVQSPNLSCRETTPRRGQSGRKNMSRAPHFEHLKRRLSSARWHRRSVPAGARQRQFGGGCIFHTRPINQACARPAMTGAQVPALHYLRHFPDHHPTRNTSFQTQ